MISRNGKIYFSAIFFLLLTITRSSRLAEVRWSICITKSQRLLWISFSRTDSGLCIYHLFVWSNLNFLHNSQWITLPTQSCLVLYSLFSNLLYSLIISLIISSVSSHQNLLFCALSIFSFDIDRMALFCAAIKRDSVSLLSFHFLGLVLVFSCEIFLFCPLNWL